MDSIPQLSADFLIRAHREGNRYGEDPWVFLRELVQNARDAHAHHIDFTYERDRDVETVVCSDDGRGMTRQEVCDFLLRLYASSKESGSSTRTASAPVAGRFGVGFWSILRFAPERVVVNTRRGRDGVHLEIDAVSGRVTELQNVRHDDGTTISIDRRFRSGETLHAMEHALLRLASRVNGLPGQAAPILRCQGKRVNEALDVGTPFCRYIEGDAFQAAMGLGSQPVVKLYSHGLLVREAASFVEILPRHMTKVAMDLPGLYPIIEVNCDQIELLLDRQQVQDTPDIRRVIRVCEDACRKMQLSSLDAIAPLPWRHRCRRKLRALARAQFAVPFSIFLLLLILSFQLEWPSVSQLVSAADVFVEGLPQHRPPPSARASSQNRTIASALSAAATPRITPLSPDDTTWNLSVVGDGEHWIRIATYSQFDERFGLLLDPIEVVGLLSETETMGEVADDGVEITVTDMEASTWMVLPVPQGHAVAPNTVELEDTQIDVYRGVRGEAIVHPARGGSLQYQTRRAPLTGTVALHEPQKFALSLPEPWASRVGAVIAVSPATAAEHLADLIRREVRYTTSEFDQQIFDADPRSFVERVTTLRMGDCDIMNALLVLLLRAADVPARLSIGFIVRDGQIAPQLHAWTEFFDQGRWMSIDATPTPQRSQSTNQATPSIGRNDAHHDPSQAATSWAKLLAHPATLFLFFLVVTTYLLRRYGPLARAAGRVHASVPPGDHAQMQLVDALLCSPLSGDTHQLNDRQLFPTLHHGNISLREVEDLSRQGNLVVSSRDNPWRSELPSTLPILDASHRVIQATKSRLPFHTWLDQMPRRAVELVDQRSLQRVQEQLRRHRCELTLHATDQAGSIDFATLPCHRHASRRRHHVLIPTRRPDVQDIFITASVSPALATFRLAQLLAVHTPFLDAYAERLLDHLSIAAFEEHEP